MQQLIDGVHRFRREEFGQYQELFRHLSEQGQKPHTLFITCADSRVLAELITQSQPGELFVIKNMGNIVPPATAVGSTNSTAAAIEFAVEVLEVGDIVVCGHTQCGAMDALLADAPVPSTMPHLTEWLEVAGNVRQVITERYHHLGDLGAQSTAAAEENVLFALENLHTYACVAKQLLAGKLRLHGWMFKISTAELFSYDPARNIFVDIAAGQPPAAR
jgi:carbonic anhydrase